MSQTEKLMIPSPEFVHVTDNVKFAAALTAVGFALRNANNVVDHIQKREKVYCELDHKHNGVDALELKAAFENKINIESRVNEIIEVRGITQEEYISLAFDAACCALHNRSKIIHCVNSKKPLIAMDIGNGRSIIYRDGTPEEEIKKLIRNT
jgi:DNA-directed RNA polymerase specialized sigma subunit